MKNYLCIAVLLITLHKTLIPETETHTHLSQSKFCSWHHHLCLPHPGNVCQSWLCSAQQMNLLGRTARAATHSITMGRLLSGLKDTQYTPPPRESKNTPYPAPQSTCWQLEKLKWHQVLPVNSYNPPNPLGKVPREKFTIAVNLAWAQLPAPG